MLTPKENEVRNYLISSARQKKLVPYSQLAKDFGLDIEDKHQAWINVLEVWMESINDFELEHDRPLLSAIIVLKKNPNDIYSISKSGAGFYKYARAKGLLQKGQNPELFQNTEIGKIFRYWNEE
ncbi:MAG: hypothetical protein Q8R04_05265 [Nanoarchaeota archaeon]|nr:hypothetical protein [Nanoarchaeota archaeon]